jgi:hypothetical protein
VTVSIATTTSGIDFALERLGGISGTVTVAGSGLPLDYAYVDIYDLAGSHISYGYADASGHYAAGGLPSGTYFARSSTYDYADELYYDIPCNYGCDITAGVPIRSPPRWSRQRDLLEAPASPGTITETGSGH